MLGFNSSKKGMSTIIANLIVILLVIVAVGIVWTVVEGLIEDTTDQMDFDDFDVEAEISDVTLPEGSDDPIKVQVKNNGKGDLDGVNFVFYDEAGNTEENIDRDEPLPSKEVQTFEFEDIPGIISKIAVTPRMEDDEGEIKPLDKQTGEEEFSNKDILRNLGAVAWFKMDRDRLYNELGGGSGTLDEDVECGITGKYKQACDFSEGEGNYSIGEGDYYFAYYYEDAGSWEFCGSGCDDSSVEENEAEGILEFSGSPLDEVIVFESELDEEVSNAIGRMDLSSSD